MGLWAVDSAAALRPILREGGPLLGKTVKAFNVLKAVAGSTGAAHAYNSAAAIVAQVTFMDNTTAIVKIAVP